jgi:hypothetical protein
VNLICCSGAVWYDEQQGASRSLEVLDAAFVRGEGFNERPDRPLFHVCDGFRTRNRSLLTVVRK